MADSPQPSKTPSSNHRHNNNAAVQESPVFNYLSNLSPIQPVKPVAVAQGLPGVDSPPFIFTSPRTNLWSQPSPSKRPQFLQSASASLSETHQICKGVADDSGTTGSELKSGLRPFANKGFDFKSSVHDQAASPSESADTFLADIVNMTRCDSVSPTGLKPEQSDDMAQPVTTNTDQKGSVYKVDNKDHRASGFCSALPEQTVVDKEQKVSSFLNSIRDEVEQKGNFPSGQHPKMAFDSPIDPAFRNQHQDHSISDNSTANHMPAGNSVVDPDSKSKLQEHKFKTGQDQRGIRRRCLQFGDVKQKISAKEPDFSNSGDANHSSSLSASGTFYSSSLDLAATSAIEQVAKSFQSNVLPRASGSSILNGPKPPGIGLHLNRILNSVQHDSTASMKSVEIGNFSVHAKKSISLLRCHSSESVKSQSLSSDEVEHASAINDNDRYERDEPIAENSATVLSPYGMKPLHNSMSLKSIKQQTTSSGKRNYTTLDNINIFEECNQSSPRNNRNKVPDMIDGDGCKRCNCKKTKCLKLYCDCFAAGAYCGDSCSCQGCFNRPEYEDTVQETKQQIESRNPLAFAPKIVANVAEPITKSFADNGACFTPSSARHKRGCNCKKSMCLKKYCECFQATVGCSEGCRCEGCQNVFGRKEEYGKRRRLVWKQDKREASDVSFNEKLEMVATRNDPLQADLCNPHNLTALTPLLEYSNSQGMDGSNFLFSSGRFLRPPESANYMQPYEISPGSSRDCSDRDMIQDSTTEILDLVSFDQELDYGNGNHVNEFSQRYNGSGIFGHHLHSLSSPHDWATTRSQPRVISGTSPFSPGNSLQWHRSPLSPINYFEGNKFLGTMDSSTELYKTLGDDTPDVLKENIPPPNAASVNVSSPNKKRVSPPRAHSDELVSSSSSVLKTCHKFIFQDAPSFPSLTPSLEPKCEENQRLSGSENCPSSQ